MRRAWLCSWVLSTAASFSPRIDLSRTPLDSGNAGNSQELASTVCTVSNLKKILGILPPCPMPPDPPTTVLCIDDEDDQLLLRKLLLEQAGYRVFTAKSGSEGIRLFQTEHIDLVIVDYWMSGMNGVVVARALKELCSKIPVIMLSGYAELPDEALGAADAWLIKSQVEPQKLLAVVKELLKED